MKKLILTTLLALVTMAFSGCVNKAPAEENGNDSRGGRTELVLATDIKFMPLDLLISSFNSYNKDYYIKAVYYSYDDASSLLNVEIGSGNAPDIYAFRQDNFLSSTNFPVYEDLFPYLDADEELSRGDFVQSLLNALTEDEKLYSLPYEFSVNTFIARESVVGDVTGISIKDAKAFASQMGQAASVFPGWMDKETVFSYVLSFALSRYSQRRNGYGLQGLAGGGRFEYSGDRLGLSGGKKRW